MTVAAQKQLAGQLLKSLDEDDEKLSRKEWDAAWKKELEKRIEDVRTGKVKTISASQVMAELRARHG